MDSASSLIKGNHITIGYGRTPMIEGIDLEIHPGDYLALVGPNGAGKSTLLKTLLGMVRPIRGRVTRRQDLRVGYVPQRENLDPIFPISALEVVRSGVMGGQGLFERLFRIAPREAARKALDTIGLSSIASLPFRDLSYGQQQRVLIARALIREPELLVLDEPTAGMDMPSESELLDVITYLNGQGIAVVLVVHQLSIAAGRAKTVAFVNKDRFLFAVGGAGQWLTEERLTDLYNHPMKAVDVDGVPVIRAVSPRRPS